MGTFGAVPERVRSCRGDFLDYLSKERPHGITDTEPASVSIEGKNYKLTAKKSGPAATVEIWQVYHSDGFGTRLPPRTRVCALNVSTQGVYFQGSTNTSQVTDPEKLLQIVFECLQKGKQDSGLPVITEAKKVETKVARTVAPQESPRGGTLSYTSSTEGSTTYLHGKPLRPIAEPPRAPASTARPHPGPDDGFARFDSLLKRMGPVPKPAPLEKKRVAESGEKLPELSELLVLDPGWQQGQPPENNLALIMARFVMTAKPHERSYESDIVRNVVKLAEAKGLGDPDRLRDRAWKIVDIFLERKILRLDESGNGSFFLSDVWKRTLASTPEKATPAPAAAKETAEISPKLKALMAFDTYPGSENPETNRAVQIVKYLVDPATTENEQPWLIVDRVGLKMKIRRTGFDEILSVFNKLRTAGVITSDMKSKGLITTSYFRVSSEWCRVLEQPAGKEPSAEKVKPTKEALLACDPAWDGRPGNNRAVLILEYLLNPKTERTRVKYFMIQQIAESRSRNSPRDYEQVKAALQSLVQKGIIIEKDTDRHESDRSYEVTPGWGEVLQGLEKKDGPSRDGLLACDPAWQKGRVPEASIALLVYRDLEEFGNATDGDRASILDNIAYNYALDRTKLSIVFDAMVAKGILIADSGRFVISKEWQGIQL